MRKLIVTILSTLDGYAAGEGGNIFVMPIDLGFDTYNAERLRHADILLAGATTYRQLCGYWPTRAGDPDAPEIEREISRLNGAMRKVVVSDSLTADETGPWADTTQIVRRDEAHQRVAELRAEDGDGDIIVFGSVTLWNDLLARGLVDEIHLLIGPGAIGDGVPTFSTPLTNGLELISAQPIADSQLVALRYAVAAA